MIYCYVGCRTTRERNARGRGIRYYATDGALNFKEAGLTACREENPSYLTFDRTGEFLCTVHGDKESVSSYRVKADGSLEYLGAAKSGGKNPVFITPSADNRFFFVATLQGGCISTLARRADGTLSDPIFQARVPGTEEGSVSYPHQCLLDKTGLFLIVPVQGRKTGTGAVNVYRVCADGSLTLSSRWLARPHDEPRHFALHPNNRYGYLVNEKGNSVTCFDFDDEQGILNAKQMLPTLPEYYTGDGQASAMLVHPSGRFAYASNRIHESIAVFSIDEHTGCLRATSHTDALGLTPRFITMDASGKYLYVANEDSDTIRVFGIDADSGRLAFTGTTIETESPVCVIFSKETN